MDASSWPDGFAPLDTDVNGWWEYARRGDQVYRRKPGSTRYAGRIYWHGPIWTWARYGADVLDCYGVRDEEDTATR